MKTNPICCLVALIALFAFAGCSDGQYQKTPAMGQDPGAAEDDSGGLFGEQPGTSDDGIPLEDDAAAEGENGPAPHADNDDIIKPVEITKKSGDLGTCVIGEECKKTVWAKGGTGEFVWTLVEGTLPKGVGFDSKNNKATIKTIEGQGIEEVGEFHFTVKVEDAADPTRSAERKCTLRVEENIAMVLYTMAVGAGGKNVWTLFPEKDESGNAIPVIVKPNGFLLVEVIGHADSYTWSINGEEIVCGGDDQACKGTKDGLTLYRDTELSPPEPQPEHFQYMILKAEENFIGTAVENVVIAAKQDYGDPVSKTISSITFEQEPCKIPLAVTGGGNVTRSYGQPYNISLQIEGGSGSVTWTPLKDTASVPKEKATMASLQIEGGSGSVTWTSSGDSATVPAEKATMVLKKDGREASISGNIDAQDGMTLEEYLAGEQIQLQYQVEDSCAPKNSVPVIISISVKGDEDLLRVDLAKRSSSLHLGANDTDGSSTIQLFLTNDINDVVGQWDSLVGLDQYGDGETCWTCYDIDGNHSVSQPSMTFDNPLSIDQMTKARFLIKDPGCCGYVDVKINEYHISFPHWSGAAQGVNYDMDDIDDGSYRDFDIAWTYKN